MKSQLKNLTNKITFIFLIMVAMLAFGFGCNTSKPTPDPLAGWRVDQQGQPNQVIVKDYLNYIHTLSPEEQKYAGPIFFYEDGMGQYAVKIEIGINGTSWVHVLIYYKDNKRINTIKYSTGRYAS
jgi:hypothetical protein